MGTVACCKKPNEIIEDQDVFKKSTIKKTMNFNSEQNETQNPFQKEYSRQKHSNIHSEKTINNNFIDLEETKNTNNFHYTSKIEHQSTNGPSDNLRKKRNNKIINNDDIITNNDYNNIKTKNAFGQIQINTNSEYNRNNNYNNINNQIMPRDEGIEEKKPQDKISFKNSNNNIKGVNNETNQLKEISSDINMNINMYTNIDNNSNANHSSDRQPLNITNKIPSNNQIEEEEEEQNLIEQNQNVNLNNKENENNIIKEDIETQNLNIQNTQKETLNQFNQEQFNISNDIKISLNNNRNNINEEPQNSNQNINLDNNLNNNNQNYNSQDLIKNHTRIDSQITDEDDPKDTNEINPNLNQNLKNTQEKNNPEEDENLETKEAFLQSADGQIIPTQQISDSEIAYLYQQCNSKGETEPDDDFNFDSYKKFYPEDDPFFIFDKGEVSDGQIISSPDELENLEIYEGEINEQNKKHGQGILTTPEYVRKGTWRNGEFTGWGRESRRNKEVLEGKFINGLLNGKGIFKNSKNNLYTGDFVNSKREGTGELYTNRIHYIGEFKEDKLNGKGIIEFLKEGHKYEGDFQNNEINGIGIFQWKNGDIYQGEMTNGKMNGHGIYKYANGQIYDGEYNNGIREGKGRIIINNTIVYDGEFRGGHRVEQGRSTGSIRFTNNGNVDNNDTNEIEKN